MHEEKAISIHSGKHGIPTHVGKPVEATKCIARILSALCDLTPKLKKTNAVKEEDLLSHISTKYGKDYRSPPASKKKWDGSIQALKAGAFILCSKQITEGKQALYITCTKQGIRKHKELKETLPELFEVSTSPNTHKRAA